MKKIFLSLTLLLVPVFFTLSCEEKLKDTPTLSLNPSSLSFSAEGEAKTFEIKSNTDWSISTPADAAKITLSEKNGSGTKTITVTLTENPEKTQYSAKLTVEASGASPAELKITQAGTVEEPEENVEIKDANFLTALLYVSKKDPSDPMYDGHVPAQIDANDDGQISQAEAAAVTVLNVQYCDIETLEGIEYFTSLEQLYCNDNKLTAVDFTANTALEVLHAQFNKLETIDLSKNTELVEFSCEANKLTGLDISANTELVAFSCAVNSKIGTLDVSSNTKLVTLLANNTGISELDLSNNPELELMWCHSNNISTLSFENNLKLVEIACDGNEITELEVSHLTKLEKMLCSRNKLTSIDVSSNTELTTLECERNEGLATALLPTGEKLIKVDLSHSSLSEIDVTTNTNLEELDLSVNGLSTLDIMSNTKLKYLGITRNFLDAINVTHLSDLETLFCGGQTDRSGNSKIVELTLTLAQSQADLPSDEDKSSIRIVIEGEIPGENITFDSEEFKKVVLDEQQGHNPRKIDTNNDREISAEEAAAVLQLDLYGKGLTVSSDLCHFVNLGAVDADNNSFTELDFSNNPLLWSLYSSDNDLETINLTKNPDLLKLFLTGNLLTELDLSGNPNVTAVLADNNKLTSIDLSKNNKIEGLYLNGNQLLELDLSACPYISDLQCGAQTDENGNPREMILYLSQEQIDAKIFSASSEYNSNVVVKLKGYDPNAAIQFESAEFRSALFSGSNPDVDANGDGEVTVEEAEAIKKLDLYGRGLTSIVDLKHFPNLEEIDLDGNALESAEFVMNPKLKVLYVSENELLTINVTKNPELRRLFCSNNKLSEIDLSGALKIEVLQASENVIFGMDIRANSKLSSIDVHGNNMMYLDVTKNAYLTNLTCGVQVSASNDERTLELHISQTQNENEIFDASAEDNQRVTVVVEGGAASGAEFTLADIPTDGSTIVGDTWVITDATATYDNFASLREALISAGRSITLKFPNLEAVPTSALADAYSQMGSLAGVEFAKATIIGTEALYNCGGLKSVSAPMAEMVEGDAFYYCAVLTSVNLPKVTEIGNNVFSSCSELVSIELPELTTAGTSVFASCGALQTIRMPKLTSLGATMFRWSRAITTLEIATESISLSALSNTFTGASLSGVDLTTGASNGTTVDGTTWTIGDVVAGPFKSIVVTK